MNAIPTLKPGNEARAQHAFDDLATAGFDFKAAHREGWTVSEAEPNTDGTPACSCSAWTATTAPLRAFLVTRRRGST